MAKRQNDQTRNGPARVRYFELEGSDETVQKALETFERMRRPVEVFAAAPPKRIQAVTTPQPEGMLFDSKDDVADIEAAEVDVDYESNQAAEPKRKRGEGPSVDRNTGITPASDVDFYPKEALSLKDLIDAKKPTTDMDQCLVSCYFFQEHLKLSPFGVGHVLSAFRHIKAPLPKDLRGTLRNMRGKTAAGKGWLSFDEASNIRVTTIGVNRVEHELGQATVSGDDQAK